MTPGNSAPGGGEADGFNSFCFFAELLLCKISDIGGNGLTEACCTCWSIALLPVILFSWGSSFGENMAEIALDLSLIKRLNEALSFAAESFSRTLFTY